jgi:hypothetical protein
MKVNGGDTPGNLVSVSQECAVIFVIFLSTYRIFEAALTKKIERDSPLAPAAQNG